MFNDRSKLIRKYIYIYIKSSFSTRNVSTFWMFDISIRNNQRYFDTVSVKTDISHDLISHQVIWFIDTSFLRVANIERKKNKKKKKEKKTIGALPTPVRQKITLVIVAIDGARGLTAKLSRCTWTTSKPCHPARRVFLWSRVWKLKLSIYYFPSIPLPSLFPVSNRGWLFGQLSLWLEAR